MPARLVREECESGMLIYSGTKSSFVADVTDQRLTGILERLLREKMKHRVSPSEKRAWNNSMMYMQMVVSDSGIPEDSGIAIEYNVPLTSKRVDFIITGYDGEGREHADIIELKQWSNAEAVPGQDAVVLAPRYSSRLVPTAHPSYQALSYAQMISAYNQSVQDRSIALHPCAYAHNYETEGSCALKDPIYSDYLKAAPLFGMHDAASFREFIKRDIASGDSGAVLDLIDHGKLRPSKSLQDSLASMMQGNEEFMLIDDQKVFFEKAMSLARESKSEGKKVVYIVEGGPGTGKSVIAVNMLVSLTEEGMVASYVTMNKEPRDVYKAKLKGPMKSREVDVLFRSAINLSLCGADRYDVLVVDEAHRLRESWRYERGESNQVVNSIRASLLSVFFIDRHQRVTYSDYGTVDRIREAAEAEGAEVHHDVLTSQFRCNGSDGFISWVDNVLGLEDTANYTLEGADFDFRVCESPEELERAIIEKNTNNKARLVAGYCWDWPNDNRRKDTNHHDIVIGGWSRSWNLEGGKPFALSEGSIEEVGCIHTVQGLEFEYVGVIVGPDMRFVDGEIVTDRTKRARTDASLNGIGRLSREEADSVADEIIRNTYRTLMTRASKGCYVYCVDQKLGEYLEERSLEFK